MDLNHSSCWDSILERVKPHIPTIDFNSSPCENEEIVGIYQRPGGFSMEVPEDFDVFSLDDDELEELKPVAQTCWSGNTCSQSVNLDDGEVVKADDSARGMRLDPSVKQNVDNTKDNARSDDGFLVLSFARLDQWDLDNLQNLKGDGLSLKQHVSVEPAKTLAGSTNFLFVDGDKYRPQEDVMEKLVAFCDKQLSKSVSEPEKSPNHIRQNNLWSKSSVGIAAELQQSHQEPPTVYIDLRCPDPSIKLPRTSPNLSSGSKSAAKHNTHQETPPAKKPNLKVHTGSLTVDREMTGKSMLLQKIREKRNGNKCTEAPYSVPGNEAEKLRENLPPPVDSTCDHESHHLQEDEQSSPTLNPKMEMPSTTQQSTIKKTKHQSDQQRLQVNQMSKDDQHQQILKQLEIHRPTKSVNQNQPAAERTDVLYDFEASHLPPISTLPADIESKECMLLIVNLSSPGMVGDGAHSWKKQLYSAEMKSHIYNTLVAWFLSLVGPDPRHNEDEAGAKVPFWVAGLQQLWTEDGLALHVLAVARHRYTPRKRDKDLHAPFYKHVCKFLSDTSLTLIAKRINLMDQQAFVSPIHLPSSCLHCFIFATSNKKVIDRTFGLSPGFYWQTVETQERVCKGRETTPELHTEVSVALGCEAFFLHPHITQYTLQLIHESGLDVCGLRLLYLPQGLLSDSAGAEPFIQRTDKTCQPCLALAVRGPHAHSVLTDVAGSIDLLLPRKRGPTSINPLQCRSQEPPLSDSLPLATLTHRELCMWFSGRLQGGSAQNLNWLLNGVPPDSDRVRGSLFNLSRSPSFLCATTKADLLLVVSPLVPPRCYGQVLVVCERRGFGLRGLQRVRIQSNGAEVLGLTNQQALVFCSPHTVTQDQEEQQLPSHCLVLLLRKENAMHHSVSLPAALIREFKAQKLLDCIDSRLDGVEPSFCFHTVSYSSKLFHMFVRWMWTVPDLSALTPSRQRCSTNFDVEQVVILTLCGKDMSQGLSLLHRVLTEGPEGFELLALKRLPALTRLQAQELSPYEVGEQPCYDSLDYLMSSQALMCALRRVDAFASLKKFLPQDYPGNLSVLMSPTPEVAFRQASLFFHEHEMIPDRKIPPLLTFLPQNCSTKDPQTLLTVCLFKPRIWNHALATVVCTLQLSGLTLVGLRVLTLDRSNATLLPPAGSDPLDMEAHMEYLCSGSSLALCLEGNSAVRRLLDVLGQEDSSLWTTRNSMAPSYNGIYASGSYQKAILDVKRLFPEGLCCTETSIMRQEQILNMCSDPLASVEREQSCTLETLSSLMTPEPNGGFLIHSALWQTTCLLMPLNTPTPSQVPSQLDLLGQLLRSGCHLVAARMSILDSEQRKHITQTLQVLPRGNERMAHLSMVPCLIMALQGETVVTRFNSILGSIYKERPDLEKVGKMIIYPERKKEAEQLICYLFDTLSPESCHTIVPLS